MSKSKPVALLLSLTAAALLSACDPAASVLQQFEPATKLCTDLGDGHCPRPEPDDLTKG